MRHPRNKAKATLRLMWRTRSPVPVFGGYDRVGRKSRARGPWEINEYWLRYRDLYIELRDKTYSRQRRWWRSQNLAAEMAKRGGILDALIHLFGAEEKDRIAEEQRLVAREKEFARRAEERRIQNPVYWRSQFDPRYEPFKSWERLYGKGKTSA